MKINYGYFRHRLDASNDPKLQSLIDEMGIVALGYYFSLLELYGTHYNQSRENFTVEIHRRVIANTWRKRVDSCDLVLTKFQLSGLLVYTKTKNTYAIDIPNFAKYFGSYGKIKTITGDKEKKRKEKKRNIYIQDEVSNLSTKKTNKIVANNNHDTASYSPDDLIQLWNTTMTLDNGFAFCHGLGSGKHLHNFIEARNFMKDISAWEELFTKIKKIKSLKENNIGWKVNLNWLVDYDNVLKVLNGNFEQQSNALESWAKGN
tara:strand:- start:31030 stop:31812 length:783 start_codon:yes stop_codon:yes gene_type:complete